MTVKEAFLLWVYYGRCIDTQWSPTEERLAQFWWRVFIYMKDMTRSEEIIEDMGMT
jgi:hypothetical protein